MRMFYICFFVPFLVLFFATCSTPQQSISMFPALEEKKIQKLEPVKGRVWIYKPDGSKSCGIKKGESLEREKRILKRLGLRIFKARTRHDGKMRVLVCGADTGNLFEFQIDGRGLPIAGRQGYFYKRKR